MRPRVGISACLVGEKVRWDGRDKAAPRLVEALAHSVELVPVCPEVELGLGVPRPPIRLALDGAARVRLVTVASDRDLTDEMADYAARRIDGLLRDGLDGYVVKSGSPSCGLDGLARFAASAAPDAAPLDHAGRGRFVAHLLAEQPDLPVAEERALVEPADLAAFLAAATAHLRRRC